MTKAEKILEKHIIKNGCIGYLERDGKLYKAILNAFEEVINNTLCCTEFETVSIDPDLQKSFNEYCNKQGKKEPIKKRF